MLNIYTIDQKYSYFLHIHDKNVPLEHENKKQRPFVGIVIHIENLQYYVPMGSPKEKHAKLNPKALDIYKINNGKLGILNLNNMIPIPKNITKKIVVPVELKILSSDTYNDKKYKILLNRQIIHILRDEAEIKRKCTVLHNQYSTGKLPERIKARCCNFPLLERLSKEYEKESKKEKPKTKVSLNPYKTKRTSKFTKIATDLYTYSYNTNINAIIQKNKTGYTTKIGNVKEPLHKWKKEENIKTYQEAENWCDRESSLLIKT